MIQTYDSAQQVLDIVRTTLEKKEAENNLILGLAETLIRNPRTYSKYDPVFITFQIKNKIEIICLQTPPHNLIISCDNLPKDEAMGALCQFLYENNFHIPGIVGQKDIINFFKEKWGSYQDLSYRLTMNQMIYKLDKVNDVPLSNGKFRKAIYTDLEVVAKWVQEFRAQTFDAISLDKATEIASHKIREGTFYLWETDRPVSMAGWTRPTRKGITVSFVYTPYEERKKGYATSCVAKLSELLLRKYQFCTLFTDLSNPSSNKIYQEIGYQPIEEFMMYVFNEG